MENLFTQPKKIIAVLQNVRSRDGQKYHDPRSDVSHIGAQPYRPCDDNRQADAL